MYLLADDVAARLRRLVADLRSLGQKAKGLEAALNALDLAAVEKMLAELSQLSTDAEFADTAAQLRATLPDFRGEEATRYAAALELECGRLGIRLLRHFPEYELPPLVVKVDLVNRVTSIGRTKVTSLEPRVLARQIQKIYRRTVGGDFNACRFAEALATIYDAITGGEARSLPLGTVHAVLAARTGVRGTDGYPREQFAMDIYRLRAQTDLQYDGRRFVFGLPRDVRDAIAVPTSSGAREHFSTLTMERLQP